MHLTKKISIFCAALILSACATEQPKKPVNTATPAKTTEQVQPVAKTEPAPAPVKPVVQQYALDRLKQMSDTLTSSKSFSYHSKSVIDLQSSSPLKSIDEMLDFLMTKAQISFPTADLMYSDPYAVMTKNLSHATVVGETVVNGVAVEHFAYREPNIDWEIWLTKGDKPLPLRLAMTYKQVENQPRFLVEFFDWRLNPKLKSKQFDFKAPKEAKQVEFSEYFQHAK